MLISEDEKMGARIALSRENCDQELPELEKMGEVKATGYDSTTILQNPSPRIGDPSSVSASIS